MTYEKKRGVFDKRIILKFLLYWYVGGVSYFFGTSVSNLFLVFICSFIITQYIANYLLISIISDIPLSYSITNRYLNLIVNLISNFIIVYIIVSANQYLYEQDIIKFILEPITFGVIYCVLYTGYLKLALK